MFPLSSVLFPHGALPLHIFEPRYLALINQALDDDGTFGVVLIERGSEVGGGDSRFGVGTTASIVRAGIVDDDRMAVLTVGTERFEVMEWLTDDPYPIAIVTARVDAEAAVELTVPVAAALRSWQRVAALASELGADVGTAELVLPDDPIRAIWTLCAVAPLEQIDRQRLLEIDEPEVRADRLRIGLDEQAEVLEARLSGGLG